MITTGYAFMRDLIFNALLVAFLLVIAVIGTISIWMPIVILLTYVVYLVTVFWISKVS